MEGFEIEETPSFVHRISTTTEVVRIRRHALAEGRLPLSLAEESLDLDEAAGEDVDYLSPRAIS